MSANPDDDRYMMPVFEQTEKAGPIGLDVVGSNRESAVSRFLKFACSVRLGVTLLVVLLSTCMIGMLVMQQNVEGFANYYAALTPAQQLVYGKLGFFNIYHSWYFNALLCILSLNIILATVDRLPKIWPYFENPSVVVPVRWLRAQGHSSVLTARGGRKDTLGRIVSAMMSCGFRKPAVAEKGDATFVFGESGVWNRFAFCSVHISLLTIFLGGFLTAQLGNTGNLSLRPGESSSLIFDTGFDVDRTVEITKRLPFEVACTDIQQDLIRKDGPLGAQNTIDWITYFTIKDETGTHQGMVQMNRPFDFRGYRFFQSSFEPIGRARNITIEARPIDGGSIQTVNILRNGSGILADGTKVVFNEFRGNFRAGPEDLNEDTSNYRNPAAILEIVSPDGESQSVTLFGARADSAETASVPVAGYSFRLLDFERVADRHVLSVQRDPGSSIVYLGFALLSVSLIGVFFFSHKRVWAVIECISDDKVRVTLSGNSNRNHDGFEGKFERLEIAVTNELGKGDQNG
jgi:cytochrome c biogenesis protein